MSGGKKVHQAPDDYECPFCLFLKGIESELNTKRDIIYQDDQVTGLISPRWWINNKGLVLIIPNRHYENLFDIELPYLYRIAEISQKIGNSMIDAYGCTGITVRQHNGFDADQRVWHYHVHLIPRYYNDGYERSNSIGFVAAKQRYIYADILRKSLE